MRAAAAAPRFLNESANKSSSKCKLILLFTQPTCDFTQGLRRKEDADLVSQGPQNLTKILRNGAHNFKHLSTGLTGYSFRINGHWNKHVQSLRDVVNEETGRMRRRVVLIAHAHKCFKFVWSIFYWHLCVSAKVFFVRGSLARAPQEYGVGRVGRRQTLVGTNDRGFYGESDSLHTRCRRFLTTELCQRAISPRYESAFRVKTRLLRGPSTPVDAL